MVALTVSRWRWCSSSWCTSAGPSNQQSMKLCLLNLTVARNTPPAFAPKIVIILLVTVFKPFTENCCAIKSDTVQISYAIYLPQIILPFSGMKPETDRESTLCWWLLERYPTMALCAEDELRITGVCLYCDSAKKVLTVKYLFLNCVYNCNSI